MIPVLGVPIVNGFHWLQRLVDSIDFPIDKLVILNNNSDDIELTKNLNTLSDTHHKYLQTIKVCHLPSNIGVAASWNLIIKSNINAPYWLITNNDIAFTPGLLQNFYENAEKFDAGIIHGSGGDFDIGSYDLFLIKDNTIKIIGLFDENFYPAYCEDVDYLMRIARYNSDNSQKEIIKTLFLNIPYYHGDQLSNEPNCYIESGSQTKKANEDLLQKFNNATLSNFEYMDKKWGKGWRQVDPCLFPMNIQNMPLSYTSYDLDFCRSKHIDFASKTFDWGRSDKDLINMLKEDILDKKIYERYYQIKDNDTILDIGSHCGLFPYSFKDKKIKHVFCVEPSNELFKSLKKNIANTLPSTLINKAISDTDENNIPITEQLVVYCHNNQVCSTIKFSTLINQYDISTIDFLKFDCEGGEFHIFNEENKNFIKQNVKNIAGEYHITYIDNSIEHFKVFREYYLRDLKDTSYLHVFERGGREVTKEIFDDEYLISFKEWWQVNAPDYGQLIIYANFENTNTLNNKEKQMDIFYNDSSPESDYGIIDTNKFCLNKQQDSRFFVIDNFYENPDLIREFALNQTYYPGEGAVGHRTRKQFLFEGIKERFEDIIQEKIPDYTEDEYGWRDIGINGRFQYVSAGTSLVYHCDSQRWAAMVFLNPDAPPSCGTSFFRHKKTKHYHNSQIDWTDTGENAVFNQKTFLDRTPYELTDIISNVYNRLVIFDGGLIHSASDYFGWDINTSRLFHIFFFNSAKVDYVR